jgi:hypothetical protein
VGWDGPGKRPFQTAILELDMGNKDFDNIWTTETDKRTADILIYNEAGLLIISYGEDYHERSALSIFGLATADKKRDIQLGKELAVRRVFYFESQSGLGTIGIQSSSTQLRSLDSTRSRTLSFYSLDSMRVVEQAGKTIISNKLRLAGPISPYSGGESNVIVCRKVDSMFIPVSTEIPLKLGPIPDNVVRMEDSFAWVLIANESKFSALISVPEKNGLAEREMLILNRITGEWSSLLMEGAETEPRLVNGWLAGVIADQDPRTNYEIRAGVGAMLREESVIINPLTGIMFKVHLGDSSEVLWIQGDTAYYRAGENLYRALIDKDVFFERTLLIADPRVRHIHWAFKGKI